MNEFQNISCYCLTQIQSHIYYVKILFQNISCYCLTFYDVVDIKPIIIFQNISCYCLTNEKSLFLNRFLQKRTIL